MVSNWERKHVQPIKTKSKVHFDLVRPWCSTKVDPLTSEHISDGEFYGYCPEDGSCLSAEKGQELFNEAQNWELCEF